MKLWATPVQYFAMCTSLWVTAPQFKSYNSEIGPLLYQKTIHNVISLIFHTNGRLELNLDFELWDGERDWFPL